MVDPGRLYALTAAVDTVIAEDIPGALVECGTWRGGASFLMAMRAAKAGDDRLTWLFDSYEGLPVPSSKDGPKAAEYATNAHLPENYDNCRADVDSVRSAARRLGLSDRVRIVKGWFDETLDAIELGVGPIAVLRIDADWYESVTTCLERLVPWVSVGGYVILDDYWDWTGCTLATHEYLVRHGLAYRIDRHGGAACFRVTSPPKQAAAPGGVIEHRVTGT